MTPLLTPEKYTHITPDQPLLEIFVKPSRLNLMWNSVARFGTVLWKSLSITTRDLTHKQFKEKIHCAILNILAVEDNYFDLASLLQKIRSL